VTFIFTPSFSFAVYIWIVKIIKFVNEFELELGDTSAIVAVTVLFLGRVVYVQCIRCGLCSVCLCVCLLITFVSLAQTAEPIDMPFW